MRKMTPAKPVVKHDWLDYPAYQGHRTGAKVSWRIYDKLEDAKAASRAARYNAEIDASLGYDFGYCTPGSIDVLEDGRFEVCIP
jgi:hypothetical protein